MLHSLYFNPEHRLNCTRITHKHKEQANDHQEHKNQIAKHKSQAKTNECGYQPGPLIKEKTQRGQTCQSAAKLSLRAQYHATFI